MLFDLRGRGRRRTVQIIYLGLALLMGGGLVLFGVGGATSGGLFDAFSSNNNTNTSTSYTKQIKREEKLVAVNPKNAAAWAKLASLRLAEGSSRGGFDGKPSGLAEFRQASAAWEKYTALNPPKYDLNVARQMVNLYGTTGLNQPDKAVAVLDVIVEQSPPDVSLYQQYAQLAYVAGQNRKGDLAAEKAVALSPKADRAQVKAALASIKQQVAQAAAQSAAAAAQGAGASTATAAPTSTAAPATTTTPKKK